MEDYINMNPVYYCGLQSTTCTGTEELQGSACAATGSDNKVNAAAANQGGNVHSSVQPEKADPGEQPINYRANNRRRKQHILSQRELQALEATREQEKQRQRHPGLWALAAARLSAKEKADTRKQKIAAAAAQRAAMRAAAAAAAAEAAVEGAVAGVVEEVPGGLEELRAVAGRSRGNALQAQPIRRESARERKPNQKYFEEAEVGDAEPEAAPALSKAGAGPGLNNPLKTLRARAAPRRPAHTAVKMEPDTPFKITTRAVPRSPCSGANSPADSQESDGNIQDGRHCEPRRCSCCWTTTKRNSTEAPAWRIGERDPYEDLSLCNACGIWEDRHKDSLRNSKPLKVNMYKAQYIAKYGIGGAAVDANARGCGTTSYGGRGGSNGGESGRAGSNGGGSGRCSTYRGQADNSTEPPWQGFGASQAMPGLTRQASVYSSSAQTKLGHPTAPAAVGHTDPTLPQSAAGLAQDGSMRARSLFEGSNLGHQTTRDAHVARRQKMQPLTAGDSAGSAQQGAENSTGLGLLSAAVAKARKRVGEGCMAEPTAKKVFRSGSSSTPNAACVSQQSQALASAVAAPDSNSHVVGTTAAAGGGGNSCAETAHGAADDVEMTEGEAVGSAKRRVLKLRKNSAHHNVTGLYCYDCGKVICQG